MKLQVGDWVRDKDLGYGIVRYTQENYAVVYYLFGYRKTVKFDDVALINQMNYVTFSIEIKNEHT